MAYSIPLILTIEYLCLSFVSLENNHKHDPISPEAYNLLSLNYRCAYQPEKETLNRWESPIINLNDSF